MLVKYNTCVAVFFTEPRTGKTGVRFVTGMEGSIAMWEDDQPAMKLSESFAKDIVYGLTLNGFTAAVIKVVNGVELRNLLIEGGRL